MAKGRTIGRNTNSSDKAVVTNFMEVTVNVAVEVAIPNDSRMTWSLTLLSKDAHIRYIPATEDPTERKGPLLKKDQTWTMDSNNWHYGSISIINKKNGEKPKYSTSES